MDDDDYSWVRRTRFSHSVVRSSSGREQFGAFVEQFNRGAALRQKGSSSGFKLHGLNLEPRTKLSATNSANSTITRSKSSSATAQPHSNPKNSYADTSSASSITRTRSSNAQPQTSPEESSPDTGKLRQHEKAGDHGDLLLREASSQNDGPAGNGKKGGGLCVDVSRAPEVEEPKDESPGPLEFSFHPDERSSSMQRVCSSPSPFPSKKMAAAVDAPTRSLSLKAVGEGPKQRTRARSPLPSRVVPEVFREAKSASKRFSTPPPRRKSTSPRAPNGSPPPPVAAFAPARAPGKLKHRKECLESARVKAAAQEVLEKWSVDRSQLLIGHRFSSGAHSRLFHGIYKDQPVAVKFIRQPDDEEDAELAAQLEKQFNTEIVTLSRLHHRNVIKLVGACSSPPVFCVITEFLSGGSLRSFLHKQEHKSLPLEKIISIGLDIAHGMGYIHSQGVVHRDVKPENIIFDAEYCAKIVDFGISCEEAHCNPLENDPGTFRWMAPEMMKHKPYCRKVDVYSFGLIIWEMFTGSVPYEDLTPFQAAFAVFDKNERPAIPSSCPAALRLLIEQCWAWQPDKRPDFWQIAQVLDKFKMVLDRDGNLDNMPSSNCQETHDHKNWLAHWVQKLKHSHPDLSGPPPPKLL